MALNRRVSLNDPEEDAIRRRQRLADSLAQQSVDPITIQNYQGIQAPIPVTEGLNKVLAGALGGYEDKRATQEGEDLRTRRKDEAAKYVKALDGWTNPDAVGAPGNEAPAQVPLTPDARKQLLLQGLTSDNERVQGAASTLYAQDNQAPKTVTTAEGVFILKPDGTKGERLGSPYSSISGQNGTAPMQNYAERKKIVDQFGENSPEVHTFDQYVRAMPYLNTGPSFVQPQMGTPGIPASVIGKGLNPGEAPAVRGAQAEATAAGTGRGAAETGANTRATNADRTLDMLQGVDTLIDKSTGSGMGAIVDAAGRLVGQSNPGAEAIAQLKVIQAGLMASMPRMEGPQSDRDVNLYREAAGQIAEPGIPKEQRKKAVETIRRLQEQYKASGTPLTAPAGGLPPAAAAPQSVAPAAGLTSAEQQELETLRARFRK